MPWQDNLDPSIEICAIQLPGRGARMSEKPYSSFPALIETLANVIAGQKSMPFAFFGHSLGGLLAFEVARYFHRNYLPMPKHLFVSGCEAPQHRDAPRRLHELPDDELIETLRQYNGTPPEVLQHRELLEMVLPTIRADFGLAADYRYRRGPSLTIPITVLTGKSDDQVIPEQVDGWGKETTNSCSVRWFEGDHFFIQHQQQAVLDCVSAELGHVRYA